MATQVTYIPFGGSLSGKLLKRASYWIHGNTSLPDQMNYNTRFCNDPTIQHFMWGAVKLNHGDSTKVAGSDGIDFRNQLTLNDEKIGVF